MGVSTNGQICYGVCFEEGYKFPWDSEGNVTDEEDWWTHVINKYPEPDFYLPEDQQTPTNYHKPGVTDEQVSAYFREKREWFTQHPLPITMVNSCSGEYPMWILAIPSSVKTANRGFPQRFEPSDLVVSGADKAALLDFCKTYSLEFEGEPGWYLSSYWG